MVTRVLQGNNSEKSLNPRFFLACRVASSGMCRRCCIPEQETDSVVRSSTTTYMHVQVVLQEAAAKKAHALEAAVAAAR